MRLLLVAGIGAAIAETGTAEVTNVERGASDQGFG